MTVGPGGVGIPCVRPWPLGPVIRDPPAGTTAFTVSRVFGLCAAVASFPNIQAIPRDRSASARGPLQSANNNRASRGTGGA